MNIKEVQIGYQVWIVENLNVSHFPYLIVNFFK